MDLRIFFGQAEREKLIHLDRGLGAWGLGFRASLCKVRGSGFGVLGMFRVSPDYLTCPHPDAKAMRACPDEGGGRSF